MNQAQELGSCILSNKNWLECILSKDCLCLTFQLERHKGGIYNPVLYKLPAIHSEFISADSLINSPLFVGKTGQIIEGGSKYDQNVPPAPAS